LDELFDIAVNLGNPQFDADREQVLERARAAGVVQMLVLGTSLAGSATAVELARRHPGTLLATAGVHPHDAATWDAQSARRLAELAAAPEVVAIGECGLDFERNYSSPSDQLRAFRGQLDLARELRLPLFLHERGASRELLAELRPRRPELGPVVVHCFTGDAATLDAYLELELHIGITGWICDERRGTHLRELVGRVPQGRLLVETDAPYLFPRTLRATGAGRRARNEPAYLPAVVAEIAAATGESTEQVAARTAAAARRLFRRGAALPQQP
jgi:TatD DNase family protein